MKSLILMGFKHSGKTTVGKLLSDTLQLPWIDLDRELEATYFQETGIAHTCAEIVRQHGEVEFRRREQALVLCLPTSHIISLGGGTICHPTSAAHLKTLGTLCYLQTDFKTIRTRLGTLPSFVNTWENLETLYHQRSALHLALAEIIIPCDGLSPSAVAAEIRRLWHGE